MTNPNNFDIFSAGVQGILDVGDAIVIQSFYETQWYYFDVECNGDRVQFHDNGVIMSAMASQITSLAIVY